MAAVCARPPPIAFWRALGFARTMMCAANSAAYAMGKPSMSIRACVLAAGLAVALSTPALAFQCPSDVAKIDEAMQTASLSQEQMDQVKQLRDEGERLHGEGKHQESVDTLAQAKEILGIQ
jgi:hypothetical protein